MLSIVLTEKIEELGEELRSHFNIEEFSPVSLPVQVQAQTLSWTEVNSAVCDYAFWLDVIKKNSLSLVG